MLSRSLISWGLTLLALSTFVVGATLRNRENLDILQARKPGKSQKTPIPGIVYKGYPRDVINIQNKEDFVRFFSFHKICVELT